MDQRGFEDNYSIEPLMLQLFCTQSSWELGGFLTNICDF